MSDVERLDAIEARQRLYGEHDPQCALIITTEMRRHDGETTIEACDCWLSQS